MHVEKMQVQFTYAVDREGLSYTVIITHDSNTDSTTEEVLCLDGEQVDQELAGKILQAVHNHMEAT